MKARYLGEWPADLTTLGIHVEPGDVVLVADGFEHPQFEAVDPPRGRARATAATDPAQEGDA